MYTGRPRINGESRPPCIPMACPTGAPTNDGRTPRSGGFVRIMCFSSAIRVRWVWMTPFGSAVVPDV